MIETDVSTEISGRSGLTVENPESDTGFWLPPTVNLDDGLSEREALTIALANNSAFQADLAELGLARADLVEAGELPNPVLNVLLPVDGNLNEFSIAQMLSFIWQRPRRIKKANLDVEIIADRLVQNGLALVMNTSIAHAEYIHAKESARLEREQADVLAQIADIVAAKFRLGETGRIEASIVRNEAMLLQDNAMNAAYEAEAASFNLKNLMGYDDLRQEIEVVPGETLCGEMIDDVALLEKAFNSRPDLEAARINITRAGEALGLEKVNIINLTATLDLNEQDGGDYQLSPRLEAELPLLSQNQGGLVRARAELEQAMSVYLSMKHEISLQVHDAMAQLNSACERVTYWQDTISPQLKQQEMLIEKAYSVGETAFLTVLDNKQKLIIAEKSMANAILNQKKAVAKLNFSVGQKVIGIIQ